MSDNPDCGTLPTPDTSSPYPTDERRALFTRAGQVAWWLRTIGMLTIALGILVTLAGLLNWQESFFVSGIYGTVAGILILGSGHALGLLRAIAIAVGAKND